jgi:invasion protein IalB
MAKSYLHSGIGARLAGIAAIAVTLVLGLSFVLTADPAEAQKKDSAKKADVPTSTPKSSWVKLCDKGTLTAKDKEGKELKKDVHICHTLAERIDATTGMVIVSAGLNQVTVDKEEKQIFRIVLPLGVVLPAGVGVTFFPKDIWAKIEKNEKLDKGDQDKLKPLKMSFLFCNLVGCHIEAEAKEDLVKDLKTSAGFIVTTANMSGIGVNLRVPLAGFNEALAGPPTDTKKFAEARRKLMEDIAERRKQMIAELQKKQEELNKMQPNVGGAANKKPPAAPKK